MENQLAVPGDGGRSIEIVLPLIPESTMRSLAFLAFCFTAGLSTSALGAKLFQRVTPNESTFTVIDNGNETLTFTISRDPSIISPPRDATYEIRRNGTLTITNGEQKLLNVSVSPSTKANGLLVYRFTLAKDLADKAVFQLSESEQPRIGLPEMGFGYVTQYGLPNAPGFPRNPDPFATDSSSFDPPTISPEQDGE